MVSVFDYEHPGITLNRPKRRLEIMGDTISETFQFFIGFFQLFQMIGEDFLGPLSFRNIAENEDHSIYYAFLARMKEAGVGLRDAKPRPGGGGSWIAFLDPADTSHVLTELVQREKDL